MPVNLTALNQKEIEESIKDYIKNTPEFSGYNFEGAVMSRLIKTLAYNTYLNAFYTNMAANESFLDTAQIRANVVSKAKALGYVPRSRVAAHAKVNLTFTPDEDPSSIFIPKYSSFRSLFNGVSYNFVTLTDVYIPASNGNYIKEVDIYEGNSYTYTYAYDSQKTFYLIPDEKVDISKVRVFVKPTSISTDRVEYTLVTDITEVKSDSKVYYIQENSEGLYEIYFGDGVLGEELSVGNVIQIEALITNGASVNGLSTFTPGSIIGYNNDDISFIYQPIITTVNIAADGQDKETISQIKFSAPKQYEMQKRTVVSSDYKNYLKSKYQDIQSISVWGGEDNDPPIYGKVLLSIKPTGGYAITNFRKNQIIQDLSKRSVMSIDPIIVDPSFTYINITTQVYYDSYATTKTKEEIYATVSTAIKNFELQTLSEFERIFYKSKFVAAIDNSDVSITNNDTQFLYEKRFSPVYGSTLTYKMKFNVPIRNPYAGYQGAITSTAFRLATSSGYFVNIDDDGNGIIRLYYLSGATKVYINNNAGTVDYETGEVILNSFNFAEIEGDEVRVMVESDSARYEPIRNEILLLSFPRIEIYDKNSDTVVVSDIVDVLGNVSPLSTNSILNTVVI